MDRLEGMRIFVRVVESGSFSTAARTLGMGQPAVSKQIVALEDHLGAQLVRRTSRGMNLTEAGQDFYESAVRLLADVEAAESRVGRGQVAPSGLLRVAVSSGFARLCIAPLMPEFFERYPNVRMDFQVSDRVADLIEEGIDLAIRIGELSDSSLIARRIASTARIVVATPDYIARRGEPVTPADLEQHSCIVFSHFGTDAPWIFGGRSGAVTVQPKGPILTNDAEYIRASVLTGLGIAYAPHWGFTAELKSGAVRRLLRDYEPHYFPVSAVYPGGRRPASKVTAFVDHLAKAFAADPDLAPR
jgi:LysR family transcriptional regulator, regulator for bpeEF and oprC